MPTHTFSTIQLSGWSSGRGRLGHATWNCMESDVTGAACHRAAHWYCAWRSSIAGLIARGTYWWHAATRHRYLLPPPHLMPFQWPAALDIPEYLPSALLLQTGLGEETSTGLGVPLRWPRLFAATPAAAAPSRNRRVSILTRQQRVGGQGRWVRGVQSMAQGQQRQVRFRDLKAKGATPDMCNAAWDLLGWKRDEGARDGMQRDGIQWRERDGRSFPQVE